VQAGLDGDPNFCFPELEQQASRVAKVRRAAAGRYAPPIEKPAMNVKPTNRSADTPSPALMPRHAAQVARIATAVGTINGSAPKCEISENDR